MLRFSAFVACVSLLVVVVAADADPISAIPVGPEGRTRIEAFAGDTISLAVRVAGAGGLSAAVFTVEFSDPGLTLVDYTWGGTFSGTVFDSSTPGAVDLPKAIDLLVYDAAGPVEATDIYFDAFAMVSQPLDGGVDLLTIQLQVPAGYDFGSDGETVVTIVPDLFMDGAVPLAVTGGQIVLVPEPATCLLLACGLPRVMRRRRS